MYERYIKIAHFGRICDKTDGCLQIRQAWRGGLSRKIGVREGFSWRVDKLTSWQVVSSLVYKLTSSSVYKLTSLRGDSLQVDGWRGDRSVADKVMDSCFLFMTEPWTCLLAAMSMQTHIKPVTTSFTLVVSTPYNFAEWWLPISRLPTLCFAELSCRCHLRSWPYEPTRT